MKQLPQAGLADLRLEGLGQGLPGAAGNRFGRGQLGGLLPAESDQLREGGGERREVVAAASLLPEGIPPRLRLGQLGHQGGIQAALTFQLQPQQGQIAAARLGGLRTELRFRRRQQVGVGVTALPLVQLGGEKRELLAAPGGPRGRHHSVLVVIESTADRTQQPGLMQMVPQALVGGSDLGHGTQRQRPPAWRPGSTACGGIGQKRERVGGDGCGPGQGQSLHRGAIRHPEPGWRRALRGIPPCHNAATDERTVPGPSGGADVATGQRAERLGWRLA